MIQLTAPAPVRCPRCSEVVELLPDGSQLTLDLTPGLLSVRVEWVTRHTCPKGEQ